MSISPWSAVINVTTGADQDAYSNSIQLTNGTIIVATADIGSSIVSFHRFSDVGVSLGASITSVVTSTPQFGQNGRAPHLAALTDGGFAMTWHSTGNIYSQKFTAAGAPVGTAINHEISDQFGDIATMPSGEYVVAFGQKLQIVAQNGIPYGAIDVGVTTTDRDIAVSGSRIGFIRDLNGSVASLVSYDLNGNFPVSGPSGSSGATSIGSNAIDVLSNGGFVGVFDQESPLGGSGVRAIKFMTTKPDGNTALYGEMVIANGITNILGLDVKGLSNGGFAITYSASPGGPADTFNTYVRVFNADGSSAGAEMVLQRTDPTLGSVFPELTSLSDGRLLATWTEVNNPNTVFETKMQIFDPRDGYYVGSAAADKIYGHNGHVDDIHGQGGSDTIYGLAGADTLYGDAGSDNLYDGRGDDTVYGGADGDYLYGDLGDDQLFGGDGNDTIYSFGGADFMDGGAGTGDSIFYVNERSNVTINLVNQIFNAGAAFGDTIVNAERIYGAVYFTNNITGDAQSNILVGGTLADTLNGGANFDILRGGQGADNLTGGTSGDYFSYTAITDAGDTITDFATGDKFQFVRAAFGGLAGANVAAANFLSVASGHVATTATQRFIFDQAVDQLWYDADGNGGVVAVMIADLSTNYNLLNTDLLLA
jgi:Ca2+-binding RTX toxin-like protein